ncbi:hypothetical protein QYS49_14190 [Marivirga salinae]|uniref:ATP-grasp domain-containing protein n=1 Tax=Marivirga salinarum TaxID=3059078 RepID=A0AA49J9S6_9BACT|nr:hypothetical protein [Marivirga sp. BDSF4-3]WKK78089.1 hypothetical protein QYS49_14190 [Marivirga sp. BDSF4-3]
MSQNLTLLYLTDLYYPAKGRNYYEEDLYITSQLKEHFNILIGNPQQALGFLDKADSIVFRNTGPVAYYQEYFNEFVNKVKQNEIPTFNSFDGKADMKGKQYLLDLFEQDFPVIPTINSFDKLHLLPNSDQYIIKLKNGADSIGMEKVSKEELNNTKLEDKLIQPFIDFEYEVSFYFINDEFQYALYAPDKSKRWELKAYKVSEEDLEFAQKFIRWNNMKRGIQRVDACKLKDGSLLLVELEDLNPFLSLESLNEESRDKFLQNFIKALKAIPSKL